MFRLFFKKTHPSPASTVGWREYQSTLNRQAAASRLFKKLPLLVMMVCAAGVLFYGAFRGIQAILKHSSGLRSAGVAMDEGIDRFDRTALQQIIRHTPWNHLTESRFPLYTQGRSYDIVSSIDPGLQQLIVEHLDRKNSKYLGFVALDPETGRILAMVSHDRDCLTTNICLQPAYPAASIFKIVTAAAAIETCGFGPDTTVYYSGNKYTLYKTQLTDKVDKYANAITFENAFAGSINSVFGKIGIHRLGSVGLETFAAAFGFNQPFDFEIPLPQSTFVACEEAYQCAEAASGLNHRTLLSPLHGALMVAAVANQGRMMAPTLIDTVRCKDEVVYEREPKLAAAPISAQTARTLKQMMTRTVAAGTAAKSFAGYKKDPVLAGLIIGGKTGSINNNPQRMKYDWFAGFAQDPDRSQTLVFCALVVHKDYIGIKSARYSRMAIKEYFDHHDQTRRLPPSPLASNH